MLRLELLISSLLFLTSTISPWAPNANGSALVRCMFAMSDMLALSQLIYGLALSNCVNHCPISHDSGSLNTNLNWV